MMKRIMVVAVVDGDCTLLRGQSATFLPPKYCEETGVSDRRQPDVLIKLFLSSNACCMPGLLSGPNSIVSVLSCHCLVHDALRTLVPALVLITVIHFSLGDPKI